MMIKESIQLIQWKHMKLGKILYGRKKLSKLSLQENSKVLNVDYITKKDIKEHNTKWPETPDHPHRILIIGGFGSTKTNPILNLINHEPDVEKIYLYAKDPSNKAK